MYCSAKPSALLYVSFSLAKEKEKLTQNKIDNARIMHITFLIIFFINYKKLKYKIFFSYYILKRD
ncbi:MAG: hypothetical protein LBQ24_04520 [Candidatus Peribacteria bacterium]|jgi:hypothetical protein|nr:hypothetical protein [Candidatus Peribacteria bacterium]